MKKSNSDIIFEMYIKDRKSVGKIAEELKIKRHQVSGAIKNKLKQMGEQTNLYFIKQNDLPRILKKYNQKKQENRKL